MSVSKRARYEVLKRDNFACRYCGASAPDARLTVDHVVPVALGGSDKPDNLWTACIDCNSGKASSNPDAQQVADVAQDAIRWAVARKEVLRQYEEHFSARLGVADRIYHSFEVMCDAEPDADAIASLVAWQNAGLSENNFVEFVFSTQIASKRIPAARRWSYFAGCCWTRLREMDDWTVRRLEARDRGGA